MFLLVPDNLRFSTNTTAAAHIRPMYGTLQRALTLLQPGEVHDLTPDGSRFFVRLKS